MPNALPFAAGCTGSASAATYRITDEKPIPKQYAESERGAYLAGQITDVHKRGALSHKPGPDQPQVEATAQRATQTRATAETRTPAEAHVAVTTDERMQAVERLWDAVERDYASEQTVYAERDAVRNVLDAARDRLEESTREVDATRDRLLDDARASYGTVEDAAVRLDAAGFFTRSAREAEYQQAVEEYRDHYGTETPPQSDDEGWLRQHPEYAEAQDRMERDRGDVAAAEGEYAAVSERAEQATATREASYQAYATARDENPQTRVTTANMGGDQRNQATDLQAARDQRHLATGTRPGAVRERNRSAARSTRQPTPQRTSQQQAQRAAQQRTQRTPPPARHL